LLIIMRLNIVAESEVCLAGRRSGGGSVDSVVMKRSSESAVNRRQAILEAALQIIGEEGSSALTHRRVAEWAGVSLSATTYYFHSIDEIFEQALLLSARRELTELAAVHEAFDRGDMTVDEWARGIARVVDSETRGRKRRLLLAQFEMDLAAARRVALRRAVRELNARYESLVEQVLRKVGSPEPASDARVFVAAVTGLLLEQLSSPSPHFGESVLAPAIVRIVQAFTSRPVPPRSEAGWIAGLPDLSDAVQLQHGGGGQSVE
jgi:DNA-binding transcriptional regulator YbjK